MGGMPNPAGNAAKNGFTAADQYVLMLSMRGACVNGVDLTPPAPAA
ncbi:hypothetical protein [Ensifer sp. LC163]|nr:hypothetical protein [Ensifer sp. LC163]